MSISDNSVGKQALLHYTLLRITGMKVHMILLEFKVHIILDLNKMCFSAMQIVVDLNLTLTP